MQKQDYTPFWAHFYPVSIPELRCIVEAGRQPVLVIGAGGIGSSVTN